MHRNIACGARSSVFANRAIADRITKESDSPSTIESESTTIRLCDDIPLHCRVVADSIFAQKIALQVYAPPAPCPPAMKMHSHLRYLEDPITDLSFTEKSKREEGSLVG